MALVRPDFQLRKSSDEYAISAPQVARFQVVQADRHLD
jgi:hypothetical protein